MINFKYIRALVGVIGLALAIIGNWTMAAEMEDTITVSSTAFAHHGTVPAQRHWRSAE